LPVVIYALSLWLVGLGGGFALAFNVGGEVPTALHGARGFWVAATAGLVVAAAGLSLFLRWVMRNNRHNDEPGTTRPAGLSAPAG
jgi:MATE family multidrug resistance protein